jgi:hypothetical protein
VPGPGRNGDRCQPVPAGRVSLAAMPTGGPVIAAGDAVTRSAGVCGPAGCASDGRSGLRRASRAGGVRPRATRR